MKIGDKKYTLYDFQVYEHEHFEKYLNEMQKSGWELCGLNGIFLKFKKSSGSFKKYSVDILGEYSIFERTNCSSVSEYKDFCESAGWEYIDNRGKVYIYSSSDENAIPIQTDNESVYKVAKKSIYLVILTLVLMLVNFGITINLFDYTGQGFASYTFLGLVLMYFMWMIELIFTIGNYINWRARGQINKVSTKIKNLVRVIVLTVAIVVLLNMIIGEGRGIASIIIVSLVMLGLYGGMNIIKRLKLNRKNKIIVAGIFMPIIGILIFSMAMISILTGKLDLNTDNAKVNMPLKIEDFIINENREIIGLKNEGNDKDLFMNEYKSTFLASYYKYSYSDGDAWLNYDLLETKYKWIIDLSFNKYIKGMRKGGATIKQLVSNNKIDIYSIGKISYVMISDDKYMIVDKIEDHNLEDEKEFLELIYEKVFV